MFFQVLKGGGGKVAANFEPPHHNYCTVPRFKLSDKHRRPFHIRDLKQ